MKKYYFTFLSLFTFQTQFISAQNFDNSNNNHFTMDTADTYNLPWPAWVFSHWIWEDESTQQSAQQLMDDYLAYDIPVGAIIIDSPWETGYNTFVFDQTLYPDPQAMVDYFHSKNVKVMMWITGVINIDVQPLYDSIANLGWFMKQSATASGPAVIEWWKGDGSLIDFYNPDALAWWKGLMDKTLDYGIDGWKCDGTDYYAIGATYSPYLGSSVSRLNYSHTYYQLFHDYTRERLGNKRVNTSRPIDNYGLADIGGNFVAFTPKEIGWACWVGDQDATFDGMKKALNNMYWSDQYGYLAFGSDIAGYRDNQNAYPVTGRDRELYIRWMQLGALSPVMENGSVGPWMYDQETADIYRRFAKFHTSLIPYLMGVSESYFNNGEALMQFFNKTDYSFMLGPDIFVAPILAPGGNVTVNFPAGSNWVYLFDTTLVKTGGTSEALSFPLSEYPVYVRQGSIYSNLIKDPGIIAAVAENKTKLNFSLYPNPANSQLTIEQMFSNQLSLISIYNTTGQLVLQTDLNFKRETINIAGLSPGIYYLHLQTAEGAGVKKFEIIR